MTDQRWRPSWITGVAVGCAAPVSLLGMLVVLTAIDEPGMSLAEPLFVGLTPMVIAMALASIFEPRPGAKALLLGVASSVVFCGAIAPGVRPQARLFLAGLSVGGLVLAGLCAARERRRV